MADVIKFHEINHIDEGDAILEDLMRPEHPNDIDEGETNGEAEKNNLIHLPKKSWPPIDWDEVESIRQKEYPRVPKKVVVIIKKIFKEPGDDCYFDMQNFEGEPYPPDPIPLRPIFGDAVWMIDLLDRFGGEVRRGKQRCIIKRKKKKPALFLIQPISRTTRDALTNKEGLGSFFEHYLESKSWTIWGKEVTPQLMAMIINNRSDEDRIYLGWFDRKTAWVLFRRMKDISIEAVLMLE